MSGRPVGSRELSTDQIKVIIELSEEGRPRPEIAEKADCGEKTVYRYQKKYGYM